MKFTYELAVQAGEIDFLELVFLRELGHEFLELV